MINVISLPHIRTFGFGELPQGEREVLIHDILNVALNIDISDYNICIKENRLSVCWLSNNGDKDISFDAELSKLKAIFTAPPTLAEYLNQKLNTCEYMMRKNVAIRKDQDIYYSDEMIECINAVTGEVPMYAHLSLEMGMYFINVDSTAFTLHRPVFKPLQNKYAAYPIQLCDDYNFRRHNQSIIDAMVEYRKTFGL